MCTQFTTKSKTGLHCYPGKHGAVHERGMASHLMLQLSCPRRQAGPSGQPPGSHSSTVLPLLADGRLLERGQA
eukprot:1143281-Pelagomonas_calceolata.AAC.2